MAWQKLETIPANDLDACAARMRELADRYNNRTGAVITGVWYFGTDTGSGYQIIDSDCVEQEITTLHSTHYHFDSIDAYLVTI